VANAGAAQTVTLPTSSATLTGTGSDPEDGTNVTFAWSQVSGPSTATLATPNAISTQATGLVAGTYTFRLTVTDTKGATTTATTTVNVVQSGFTLTVNAGTGGSVTRSLNQTTYAAGTNVTLTAVPQTGYRFTGWSGGATGTTNPVTVTMNANVTVTASFAPVSTPTAIRINTGGAAYTYPAPDSRSFAADVHFSGGTPSAKTVDLPNRTDDALYQNLRFGTTFGYNVPVTNGTYDVTLHFAEIYWGVNGVAGGIGKRVFSVNVEGQPSLTNFDITKEAGGPLIVVQRTFRVNVTDGVVNLSFFKGTTGVDNATVSAIEVVPVTTARETAAAASGAESELRVRAFPNPTNGKFRVELAGADAGQVTTLLRDAVGGERLRNRHKIMGERTLELDVTDQRGGVYLLEVQSGSRRQVLKIVKQ
jgi:uncharacterized repeat protein (TIGR02543 family)